MEEDGVGGSNSGLSAGPELSVPVPRVAVCVHHRGGVLHHVPHVHGRVLLHHISVV